MKILTRLSYAKIDTKVQMFESRRVVPSFLFLRRTGSFAVPFGNVSEGLYAMFCGATVVPMAVDKRSHFDGANLRYPPPPA